MTCVACGRTNRAGRKFCAGCGAPLALACPACGGANEPDESFCGECGAPLAGMPPPAACADEGGVERRVVSVLFADLVGSTSLAEGRDAEEVRALLNAYFDAARQVIERYGGTVEKFIGDAVMAVWGTPVAREDDAERTVRAALELVETVAALDLVARAGVLTGEAAVAVGATGQAMVAGDLVNTASRVQSLAAPGAVLVGETTHRATRASIAYAEEGLREIKGREEPVALWRALRVTGRRGGAGAPTLLEPPFVGRTRELRLVKELFHSSAEARRAQLVTVVGQAGIGKSRLAWELAKYLDGVAQTVYWHRGRCLAYGDGVTYSALAEMVRMRCGIAEGEDAERARVKLRDSLAEHVADADERKWLEPRLAHLLALEERGGDDADLFAAWRVFFEHLADRAPVVLVFEDMQWADAALLAFVEHLLEWSAAQPIVVLALARPELRERHAGWPAGSVNVSRLALEPLQDEAMAELIAGLVPGLPDDVRVRILARAEGMPLYAVETVRMLLDRRLIEREGDEYRVVGAVEDIETPETLHALIAARLDGLEPDERRVLQSAAVLGKAFAKDALAALAGVGGDRLDALLTSLVRKEALFLQADPRSPERGQYSFLQDLLRQVAYETLSKKERRARHLAVAAWLEEYRDDADVVEVVAAHYASAYESDPSAPDAATTKERARALLVRAGERAASLAAPADAQRYFERALELADDPGEQAALHERAGTMALRLDSRSDEGRRHLEQAIEGFTSLGLTHAAARVSAVLALAIYQGGNAERAVTELERAYEVLAGGEPDEDVAFAAERLARLLILTERWNEARVPLETALEVAETLRLPEVLANALNTKALLLRFQGRHEEGRALLAHALAVALEHDLPEEAWRAHNNISFVAGAEGRLREVLEHQRAHAVLARRLGDRELETFGRIVEAGVLVDLGEWDEAVAMCEEVENHLPATRVLALRGDVAGARPLLEQGRAKVDAGNPQWYAAFLFVEALVLLAEERPGEALAVARQVRDLLELNHPTAQHAFAVELDAAFAAGDADAVDELLTLVELRKPVQQLPVLDAAAARGAARRDALRGHTAAAHHAFLRAAASYRQLERPFGLACTLLDHGEWLTAQDRADEAEPLLAEAAEIFGRLRATPWLDRVRALRAEPAGAPA